MKNSQFIVLNSLYKSISFGFVFLFFANNVNAQWLKQTNRANDSWINFNEEVYINYPPEKLDFSDNFKLHCFSSFDSISTTLSGKNFSMIQLDNRIHMSPKNGYCNHFFDNDYHKISFIEKKIYYREINSFFAMTWAREFEEKGLPVLTTTKGFTLNKIENSFYIAEKFNRIEKLENENHFLKQALVRYGIEFSSALIKSKIKK